MASKDQKKSIERLTFSLPKETREAIEIVGQERGLTLAGAVKRLIAMGLAIDSVVEEGGEVTAQMQNGTSVILANSDGEFIRRRISRTPSALPGQMENGLTDKNSVKAH